MTNPTQDEFLKDVANHKMTILHEQGVYRHIRFAQPNSGIGLFNLTTFPGRLCYSGDMGTYVFVSTDDMFGFFRRGDGEINEGYWAEKIEAVDRHGAIKKFSERIFREVIAERLDDMEANKTLREAVADDVIRGCDEYDDRAAHRVVSEFTDGKGREVFCDSYELDFTEYTRRFIWCLRAIVWGIAKYDESRAATDRG